MIQKNIILLPIEIKSREFNAKMYFASQAIRRGYEVWIGFAKYFHENMPLFPRGILIENDVGKGMGSILPVARRLGFAVTAWDEEALVVKNDDFYVDERVPYSHIKECYRFFTRGEGDRASLLRRYPDLDGHLIPAGNPRIDILAPEYRAIHQIQDIDVGRRIILVNSRFSHSNPYHMDRQSFRDGLLRRSNLTGKALDFKVGYMDHTDRLYESFHAMVERLPDAFPDHQIVIRPHPSESPDPWDAMAARHSNVMVSKSHTATAWSMVADAAIHNGCTTAIEAALLGCNIVAYCPVRSDLYDVRLPNQISVQTEEVEQLISVVRGMSRPGPAEMQANSAAARKRLEGLIGPAMGGSANATAIVLDVLQGVTAWPGRSAKDMLFSVKYRLDYWYKRRKASQANGEGLDAAALLDSYALEKFSGVDAGEAQAALRIFGAVDADVADLGNQWLRITTPTGAGH